MGFPLYVTSCFSLIALKTLSLIFDILNITWCVDLIRFMFEAVIPEPRYRVLSTD